MSMFDALTIPIIFFMVFIVVGLVYYETATFKATFNSTNASMSNTSQALYGKFLGVNDFSLQTMNYTIVGLLFVIIYMALVLAAIVYAHPGYFVILIFLGAAIVFLWYGMNQGLDIVIAMPDIGTYFDPLAMSWFYVIKNNMYLLISIIAAAMIFALYFKGGSRETSI